MAVAHMAPPARSISPAMKSTVSARVRIQLLRMVRLEYWVGHQPTISNSGALLTFAHCPNFRPRRLDRDEVPE
jgi:hypothetical protein